MSRTPHSIFNLPQDIIFDILSRLPTKSLIQFISVCTSSLPLITHPSFTKFHLSSPSAAADDHRLLIYYESTDYISHFYSLRSPITFQESRKLSTPYKNLHGYLRIVGSNKGLICLFDTNYYSNLGEVILWNPSISRFKKIHDDPCCIIGRFSHYVVGFGFVLRNLEFKIVKIAYYLDNPKVNCVLVYSLSTNSWKKKEDVMAPCYFRRGWSSNVVVNGFVNWLACNRVDFRIVSHEIMAFDLDNEQFRVLELPKNMTPNYSQVNLVSYGEYESLSLALCAHYGEKWDMWVMSDYGMVDSWKKFCVVSLAQPMLSNPPLMMKNDHQVLLVTNDGRLVLYDTIKNETSDLKTCGLPPTFCAISYTATLALLHG